MHHAQDLTDIASLTDDFQKSFTNMFIRLKILFNDLQSVTHHLCGLGVNTQATLLRLQEDAYHATRLLPENTPG